MTSQNNYGPVPQKGLTFPRCRPGPNTWDKVTPEDFGPEHDYILIDHGSIVHLIPVSYAALQWCYAHLPEDAPRWGANGYVIEPRYVDPIVDGMRRDGLLSDVDYVNNMNAEQQDRLAGEDQ